MVLPSFAAAADLVGQIAAVSDRLDHHPTVVINGKRVCEHEEGCPVAIELTTFDAGNTLISKDETAARDIDAILLTTLEAGKGTHDTCR